MGYTLLQLVLPISLGPMERSLNIEHPLSERLKKNNIGIVLGGISRLESDKAGNRKVVASIIDVNVIDVSRGIDVIKLFVEELEIREASIIYNLADGIVRTVKL